MVMLFTALLVQQVLQLVLLDLVLGPSPSSEPCTAA